MKEKQSGIGVVSFAISVLAGLTVMGMVVFAILQETNRAGSTEQRDTLLAMAAFWCLLANGIGLVLGTAALFQKSRKKTCAMFGTVINSGLSLAMLTVLGRLILGIS